MIFLTFAFSFKELHCLFMKFYKFDKDETMKFNEEELT